MMSSSPSSVRIPAAASRLRRMVRATWRRIDLVATAVLLFLASHIFSVLSGAPVPLPRGEFLDESWVVDLAAKAADHVWLGRDVVFSYGPFYQWLMSLPSRLLGGPTIGLTLKTSLPMLHCVAILLVYVVAALLLRQQPAWKRACFVGLLVAFWMPIPDIRVVASLCALALATRMLSAMLAGRVRPVWTGLALAATVLAAFLISADTGAYCALAVLIVTAVYAVHARHNVSARKAFATFSAMAAVCFLAGMLAVNLWAGSLRDFRYWTASFDLLSAYRWLLAFPMMRRGRIVFLGTFAVTFLIFLRAWQRRDGNASALVHRPEFLLSAFLFTLATLQSCIVRSDPAHVMLGVFPMVAMAALLLLGTGSGRLDREAVAAIALSVVLGFGLNPALHPRSMIDEARRLTSPAACPPETSYFEDTCAAPAEYARLTRVSEAVQRAAPRPQDAVAIFPFENIYGVAAHRLVAGGVLQNYAVGGRYLVARQLQGLESQRAAAAVYSAAASPIDGVSNFSRAPDVWFYLQAHYRAAAEPVPNTFVLRRDDARARRWTRQSTRLSVRTGVLPVPQSKSLLDLGAVDWPAAGSDFLRLQLQVNYPVWWRLLKPSRLAVELDFADRTHKSVRVLVPPNQNSAIWIYPWDEKQLGGYFSDSPPTVAGRPAVTHMALRVFPQGDSLSVKPSSIHLENVDAVRLTAP